MKSGNDNLNKWEYQQRNEKKERKKEKEPNRHSGTKECNNWVEKFNSFNSRLG